MYENKNCTGSVYPFFELVDHACGSEMVNDLESI